MGSFKLNLVIERKNWERIAEQRARLNDFSVPFNNILTEWADGNALKFNSGIGAEKTGAAGKNLAPATWDPVTDAYFRQKHGPIKRGSRDLYKDSLMVRTGELRAALCSRGGFAKYISEHSMAFGTPYNEEDAIKAIGNKARRPTVFLSQSDKNMIRRNLQQYLTMGGDYKAVMFAASARRYALQKEQITLDVQFREAMA